MGSGKMHCPLNVYGRQDITASEKRPRETFSDAKLASRLTFIWLKCYLKHFENKVSINRSISAHVFVMLCSEIPDSSIH